MIGQLILLWELHHYSKINGSYNLNILEIFHYLLRSYLLWERVVGGQVQGSLCDDLTTNPVLLFNMDGPNELVTMPLNLTDIRYLRMHARDRP